jgi:hypothetical protein
MAGIVILGVELKNKRKEELWQDEKRRVALVSKLRGIN